MPDVCLNVTFTHEKDGEVPSSPGEFRGGEKPLCRGIGALPIRWGMVEEITGFDGSRFINGPDLLVGGLEHFLFSHIERECHQPN